MELRLSRFPMLAWRGALDLVVPSQCLGCGAAVSEPASLCIGCWSKLEHLDDPVCDMLGTPFAYDQGAGILSAAALANPPAWDRARAAVLFGDVARELAHALKYADRQEAGLLMARMMARAGRQLTAEADIIVPVPLHYWRLWRRRFNQSAFLAQKIAGLSGRPWHAHVLRRQRRTSSQVGLDPAARRRNVKGAFKVAPQLVDKVAGRNVLLIDDIRTTGATAESCALALRAAGAAKISLLTFALVPAAARIHI